MKKLSVLLAFFITLLMVIGCSVPNSSSGSGGGSPSSSNGFYNPNGLPVSVKWAYNSTTGTFQTAEMLDKQNNSLFNKTLTFAKNILAKTSLHFDSPVMTAGPSFSSSTYLGSPISSSAALANDGSSIVGCLNAIVYCISPTGSITWSYQITGYISNIHMTAIVLAISIDPSSGAIYICSTGTQDGSTPYSKITALTSNGKLNWEYLEANGMGVVPAIAADGTVIFGTANRDPATGSSIVFLDPATGNSKYASTIYKPNCSVEASVSISKNSTTVYVPLMFGLAALNIVDGSLKWYLPIEPPANYNWTTPSIASDGTVYFTANNGKAYAVTDNGTSGSLKWSSIIGTSVDGYTPADTAVASDGTIFASFNNTFYALNPADGSIKWSFPTSAMIEMSSPTIGSDGTVYIGSWDYKLYALSVADGSLKWSYTTGCYVESSPLINNGVLYFGSYDCRFYAINSTSTSLDSTAMYPKKHRDNQNTGR